jgi:cytoplasmic iron level regulating protein YaaA (DUF328/UPF0246 family)
VYDGLAAKSLKKPELTWLESHLVILSGLYGVLKPLDALQPYRLEMGTALKVAKSKNLYEFWGTQIAQYLNTRLNSESSRVVINLASQEYFKSFHASKLSAPVVECVFQEGRNGQFKIISFSAKRARGMMARYAIDHRLTASEQLRAFDLDGYTWCAAQSSPTRLVFRRPNPGGAA